MKRVDIADVARGRRQPGPDRPDRLISDHHIFSAVRQRALKLRAHDLLRAPGVALGARFTDADDGGETGAPRRQRLGANLGIGFVMIVPALGMADNDGAGLRIRQHLGCNIAGMRA